MADIMELTMPDVLSEVMKITYCRKHRKMCCFHVNQLKNVATQRFLIDCTGIKVIGKV